MHHRAILVVLAVLVLGLRAEAETPAGQEVAVRGEVIDVSCYLRAGQKGPAHKQCTIACAKAGHDLAIYDPAADEIYFVVEEKPGTDPSLPLRTYAAETVEVVGTLYSRSGAKGIIIKSVKPAPY